MTKNEATDQLKSLLDHCKTMRESGEIWARDCEALRIAIADLCGPTREQVEVWRAEWKKVDCWNYGELSFDVLRCSECGHNQEIDPEDNRPNFCPDCGRPMTKTGVDIMLKRLEVMKDENRTD